MLLLKRCKLFHSFFFADELTRDRVGENEDPCGQKELTARDQQEKRERHELNEVSAHLTHSLLRMEGRVGEIFLAVSDLVLDDPLAIAKKCLHTVHHVCHSMLGRLPHDPRLARKPGQHIESATELPLDKASGLEHHRVRILSNENVQSVVKSSSASIFKPLVAPLMEGQTRVNLVIFVVVKMGVARLLVLCATIVLSLLGVSP